jgi:PiT family inorganic phosphate transporter
VARQIGIAWVLTIPASGIVAGVAYFLIHPILG